MRAQLDRALADRGVPLIVVDAPLLIEADLAPWCDAVVFVDAADPLRLARARADRGWSDDEVRRREAAQAPLAEKRARASVVLDNNGPVEETRAACGAALPPMGFRFQFNRSFMQRAVLCALWLSIRRREEWLGRNRRPRVEDEKRDRRRERSARAAGAARTARAAGGRRQRPATVCSSPTCST